MAVQYESALRDRYLRYITQELWFISRYDVTAQPAHQSVCDMIGSLRRSDLITLNEAIDLIQKADKAMVLASARAEARTTRLLSSEE